MWVDSETAVDYLNFATVAESVVELIEHAKGRPLSVGVSGAWGVGKSSLMLLTRDALVRREKQAALDNGTKETDFKSRYIFVSFDAWLYQGFDDARAALLDAIASQLLEASKGNENATKKAKAFLARVNWFRAARLTVGSAVALALGLPPVGLLGEGVSLAKGAIKGGVDEDTITDTETLVDDLAEAGAGLVRQTPRESTSPREQIDALRKSFQDALGSLDMTLVVLIDDLDRCLPDTAISTLEAIRLFLFLKGTAFVIAADDQMIKHAVRKHFDNPSDDLVTNYFDKLIQVPVRVPTLGTQEVRAYMFLLHIEEADLSDAQKGTLRAAVCKQLQDSWKGNRVDVSFVGSLDVELPPDLITRLGTAERLTTLMTTSKGIAGNPRLIKRFMNSLSIRMALAQRQGIGVDEEVLVKLLLFERLAPEALYAELAAAINDGIDGKPSFLEHLELHARGIVADDGPVATSPEVSPAWSDLFPQEWLRLDPLLHDIDMRGAMYVSREHLPIITTGPGLSLEAAELLTAMVEQPALADSLADKVRALPGHELESIFDRLMQLARREEEWGTTPILTPLLVVSANQPMLKNQLSGFLAAVPPSQIKAALVVRIEREQWSKALFESWAENPDIAAGVKGAITARTKKKA